MALLLEFGLGLVTGNYASFTVIIVSRCSTYVTFK